MRACDCSRQDDEAWAQHVFTDQGQHKTDPVVRLAVAAPVATTTATGTTTGAVSAARPEAATATAARWQIRG